MKCGDIILLLQFLLMITRVTALITLVRGTLYGLLNLVLGSH